MKTCRVCGEVKSLPDFSKDKSCKDGYRSECKVCKNLRTKTYNRTIFRHTLEAKLVDASRARAKKRGLEHNISASDILIPLTCPVLGILLMPGRDSKGGINSSPTLDRIDNTKGYIKGNVQVISYKANRMKSNATLEELVKFAQWVLKSVEVGE